MRACIQRVTQANVVIEGETIGQIGAGLLVLLGVEGEDSTDEVLWMAEKVVSLRIFEDDQGKMNRSLLDTGGAMLVVSQFTLLGDCRKGRRPSFVAAAEPALAQQLYEQFVQQVQQRGVPTETGKFRAQMEVSLTNDGPVTMLLDSKKMF